MVDQPARGGECSKVLGDRFAEIFQYANEPMFVIDPERDRILDANAKACHLLGYTHQELLRVPISAVHPEEMPRLLAFVRSECSPGSGWTDQLSCISKDGVSIPAEFSGAMFRLNDRQCLVAILRDASQGRRMERAWRTIVEATSAVTGTDFLRALVKSLATALGVRYAFVSELVSSTRIRARAFWANNQFLEGVEYDLANTACQQVLAGNMVHYPQNVQSQFPGNHDLAALKAVSYLGLPLRALAGEMLGHLAVIDDKPMPVAPLDLSFFKLIAERARAEVERERVGIELLAAKEAAEKANRAKSEFLANMSHELRTPLNGILGYAQILMRAQNLPEEQRDAVMTIHHCGENLLTLINDLLDLSKIEARKFELTVDSFDFPGFLEAIAKTIRVRAEQKGLDFRYQSLGDLPRVVRGAENRIRRILVNLLGNAVKFTDSGQVQLRVGMHHERMRFEVEDTGPGISPDKIEEIFLPFRQIQHSDGETEGTGLGLAISKQLTEAMGGTLSVDSRVGRGSRFILELELPLSSQLKLPASSAYEGVVGYHGPRIPVLVVDDNSANRGVLRAMLAPLGFSIAEAVNGLEALDKVADVCPRLVLMDLVMPVLDGFEATRRLRRLPGYERLVIVAVSASAFEHNRADSLAVGCDDFLSKPVQLEALLKCLQRHLALVWIRGTSAVISPAQQAPKSIDAPIPKPTSGALDELKRLADIGDLHGLISIAEDLERADVSLKPFASHLQQLARSFQVNRIRRFLQQQEGAG